MEYQSQVTEHKVIDRRVQSIFKKKVYRNIEIIDNAYENKFDITTLKGGQVREYLRNMVGLLEETFLRVYLETGDIEVVGILKGFLKNFTVLRRMKDNLQIDGWEGGNPTFKEMLELDIDKTTGLPLYGELKSTVDYVKSCKEFDKESINKFFDGWTKTLNKLAVSDYISLLNLSNKKSLAEMDVERLEDVKDSDMQMYRTPGENSKITIKDFQYNSMNAFEFISVKIIYDDKTLGEKSFFKKITGKRFPVMINRRRKKIGRYVLDEEFSNVFKNAVINDVRFFKSQIIELFFRVYNLPEVYVVGADMISIGVKTPFNRLDADLFPEISKEIEDINKETTYLIVIREQKDGEDIVKYNVVRENNENNENRDEVMVR